jgi:uncharacterized membrane protein (DUF441 family)
MKQNRIVCWCARVSGILLMLMSVPHYFVGIQIAVLQPIADGKITDTDVGETFYAIWIFSTVAMFLLGVTLVFISTDLRYLKRRIWKLALLIGLGLGGFGAGIMIKYPDSAPIAIQFLVVALITLIPLLIFSRSYLGKDAT